MDPNANIVEQERILAAKGRRDGARLRELRLALWGWFHAGGFLPDWTAAPQAARHYAHRRDINNRIVAR